MAGRHAGTWLKGRGGKPGAGARLESTAREALGSWHALQCALQAKRLAATDQQDSMGGFDMAFGQGARGAPGAAAHGLDRGCAHRKGPAARAPLTSSYRMAGWPTPSPGTKVYRRKRPASWPAVPFAPAAPMPAPTGRSDASSNSTRAARSHSMSLLTRIMVSSLPLAAGVSRGGGWAGVCEEVGG